jgi:hypothetical protein
MVIITYLKKAFSWLMKHNPIAWLMGLIVIILSISVKAKDHKIDKQEDKIEDLASDVKHAEVETEIAEVAQESATTAIIENQKLEDKQEEQIETIQESKTDEEAIANIQTIIDNFNRKSNN